MTNPTIADLMDAHIFTIARVLKDEIRPLQTITEEILVLDEPENLILVGENGKRIRFDKRCVDAVRKKFKGVEWYLGALSKREKVKDTSLLIGIMPKNHYLLIAPKKEKRLDGKVEK